MRAPHPGHHPGDGCHGQERQITKDDRKAIGQQAAEMMLACAKGNGAGVIYAGAWVGVHYGPTGELALALQMTGQVLGLAPVTDRDDSGVPRVDKALHPGDERVLMITAHCAAMFPDTRRHTATELREAVAFAMPLVQRFMDHCKHDRKHESRAAWELMYECASGMEGDRTRATTLRAGACSGLLTAWATHYSVLRVNNP
jgi:hypothetical protein